MQKTIPLMFEESVKKYSLNILVWEKVNNTYQGFTYKEIRSGVHFFAAGLISLGINSGDRIALISEGSKNWIIGELGILYAGTINVPISVKISEQADIKFRLMHSGCRAIIVSYSQLEKIRAVKNDLPDLEHIIIIDKNCPTENDEFLFDHIINKGKNYLVSSRTEFDMRWMSVRGDDYANICYTSGTTADPKGIILSHKNYLTNVEQSSALLPIPENYVSLLILPWDHAFAHTAGIFTLIKNGASIACVENGSTPLETLKNVPKNIKEICPSFLLSVPALAKNFRKNIETGIRQKGKITEKLFQMALETAYKYNGTGINKGQGLQKIKYPLLKFYDKLIFSKIRNAFGNRLEFFIGGGALLDIELQRFFYAIGIPMFQGYGLTEAAPVISANVPKSHKLGSSGKIVTNLEVKICDESGNELAVSQQGEIVCRGDNVMIGYWKNSKATEETLKNGWLFTGDLGYFDPDGFLYVLGRNKSLLISSDGEKYSPEGIEEAIVENSQFIDQIMLHNNQNPYTVALIVVNKVNLLRKLTELNLTTQTDKGRHKVVELISDEINKYKTGGIFANIFPERWLPSTFAILGDGFTEQNKFLNSTLKIVRPKITEFYKNRLDYLYTTEGKSNFNQQNFNIINKFWNENE